MENLLPERLGCPIHKPLIIVDTIGVLLDLISPLIATLNSILELSPSITIDSISKPDPAAIAYHPSIPEKLRDKAKRLILEFIFSPLTYASLPPYPGAIKAIYELAEHYSISTVTTIPNKDFSFRRTLLLNLGHNFPGISDIRFTEDYKLKIIRGMRPLWVIEDSVKIVEGLAKNRRWSILIRRPWNSEIHNRFVRMENSLAEATLFLKQRASGYWRGSETVITAAS